MKLIEQVKEFRAANNLPNATTPAMINPDRQALHMNLILEEVRELEAAMMNGNLVGTLDGICDVLYIAVGVAHETGLAQYIPDALNEVQRANMSKLGDDGKPVLRADGKIMKGPNYTPPNLKSIVFPDAEMEEE